jgi:NAD(P)-dependent dehydrogenase (short-subunit alcohol dehydrogenase family)
MAGQLAGTRIEPGPLDGRVAVISGGGKGIGRAVCLHLADLGARVVVNNRNRTVGPDGRGPADMVAAEITARGGLAVADHGDADEPGTGAALVARALEEWGRIDICVANAGVEGRGMFHRQDDEDLVGVVRINLLGAAALARAAMVAMRSAGHGRLVFVASTAGVHGLVGGSAYAASKGGMIALARTLAAEGVGRGVTTNTILPYALTQMTESGTESPALRAAMAPESVAPVVAALVDAGCTLNGEMLVVAGDRLRRVSPVEWATVAIPPGRLAPDVLEALVEASAGGVPTEYPEAFSAYLALVPEAAR